MTDYKELSKRVAELYEIDKTAFATSINKSGGSSTVTTWLHDDSARCFELMVEHSISIKEYYGVFDGVRATTKTAIIVDENYIIYKDKCLATRIAILKCLVKMKKGGQNEWS